MTTQSSAVPAAEAIRRQRSFVWATLLVYAIFAALYLTATPLQTITLPDNFPPSAAAGEPRSVVTGIGPDEKEYLVYFLSIAEQGKLPAPSPSARHSPNDYVSYQAQHPPLFFVLAAGLYRLLAPLGMTAFWFILRGLCAVCGGVVVWLAARAAAVAFPNRPFVYLAAAPFVAFTPMFAHLMANVSNEPLAMVFAAAAWLVMVRLIRAEDRLLTVRDGATVGLLLGLAALTRLTALMWLPAAVIAIGYAARLAKSAPVLLLAAFAAVFVLLVAPWFLRNQIVYGSPLLRTFDRPLLAYGSFADFMGPGIAPPNAPLLIMPLTTALWYASTAVFPYWLVQFYLPPAGIRTGQAWQALFLIADVAFGLRLFLHASRARRGEAGTNDPGGGRAVLWAAGATLLFCTLILLEQQFKSDWNVVNSPGRYLAAALPATCLLPLFALASLPRWENNARTQRIAAVSVAVLLAIFDLYICLLVRRFYVEHPAQATVQRVEEG